MKRTTVDQLVEALATSGATYSIRPGTTITATFPRAEQRNGFEARFHKATFPVAGGQDITLAHSRTWVDEHGYGLLLAPQVNR
jgi:hypothetical protein